MPRTPTGAAVALALATILALPVSAQTRLTSATPRIVPPQTFTPNVKPLLAPSPAPGPIRVDGLLDDEGWIGAARAVNFSETFPDDQTKPPIGIETWTTYDDENVYFAFVIEDDPKAVRVNMSDRDRIWGDDYVGIILDTYGTNAWAYFLASNAIGIQGDTRILGGGNEDVGFDLIFQSEGRLTDTGYQVEMAVPFRSLRFPTRPVQEWKINFWITHPRDMRNTYSWAAIDRDDPCWLCQIGTYSGIEGATPGGKIELLPAVTGSQAGRLHSMSDPGAGLDNGRFSADPSLTAKYSFSSDLVADVAVNPDFSQIESDAAQVDVNTTFALFFEERRPFFQEGSELLETPIQTVYTRSINNPRGVAKLTGRYGKTNFSYVGGLDADTPIILPFEERSSIVTAGESFSNILRVKQTFGTNSYVGGLVTDRRYTESGGSGSTFGIDGDVRLSQKISVRGQFVGSHTAEATDPALSEQVGGGTFDRGRHTAAFDGESFTGFAAAVGVRRSGRHWSYMADYMGTSPTFRAANGFITQSGRQRVMGWTGYTFYWQNGFVQRLTPNVMGGYDFNFERERRDEYLWVGFNAQLKGQTNMHVRALVFSNEMFAGEDFRGLRRINGSVNSSFSQMLSLGAFASYGRSIARTVAEPSVGNALTVDFWGTLRPTSRLVVGPNITYTRLTDTATGDEVYAGYIVRVRTGYQFTRRLFLRLVTQYNDFADALEIDPLVTYKVNPFTAVYIGSTHDLLAFDEVEGSGLGRFRQTERQLFFKLQYLFRM